MFSTTGTIQKEEGEPGLWSIYQVVSPLGALKKKKNQSPSPNEVNIIFSNFTDNITDLD